MIKRIRAVRRFATVMVCVAVLPVITTSVLAAPPAASNPDLLTPAQRTKVRQALTFSGGGFEFFFNFSAKNGTTLEFGFIGNTARTDDIEKSLLAFRESPLPDDLEAQGKYLQKLAILADAAKREESRTTALQKAGTVYQRLLQSRPTQKAEWLIELGKVQSDLNSPDAEKTWREVVRTTPNSWQAWIGLGTQLSNMVYSEAGSGIKPGEIEGLLFNPKDVIERLRRSPQNPQQVERARLLQQEALECLNKAASLAPREPRVYQTRAAVRYGQVLFTILDAAFKATAPGATGANNVYAGTVFKAFEQADIPGDMDILVRLSPMEPKFVLSAEFLKTLSKLTENEDRTEPEFRSLAEHTLPQLSAIASNNSADLEQRIQATQSIVTLYLLQKDYKTAEQVARRFLAVLPGDPRLQDLLLVPLMSEKKDAEVRLALQEALPENDAPFRRVMLAKTYLRQKRLKDAEKALREARAVFPDNAPLTLALAIIRLESAGDEESARSEAKTLLASLETSTGKSELSSDDKLFLSLAHVALAVLAGEKARAESLLREIEKDHRDDSDVQAMRIALNTVSK